MEHLTTNDDLKKQLSLLSLQDLESLYTEIIEDQKFYEEEAKKALAQEMKEQ